MRHLSDALNALLAEPSTRRAFLRRSSFIGSLLLLPTTGQGEASSTATLPTTAHGEGSSPLVQPGPGHSEELPRSAELDDAITTELQLKADGTFVVDDRALGNVGDDSGYMTALRAFVDALNSGDILILAATPEGITRLSGANTVEPTDLSLPFEWSIGTAGLIIKFSAFATTLLRNTPFPPLVVAAFRQVFRLLLGIVGLPGVIADIINTILLPVVGDYLVYVVTLLKAQPEAATFWTVVPRFDPVYELLYNGQGQFIQRCQRGVGCSRVGPYRALLPMVRK